LEEQLAQYLGEPPFPPASEIKAELFHRLLAAINWSAEPLALDEAIEQCEDECRSLEQRLKEIDQEIGKTKEQLEQLGRDNKKAQQLRAELKSMEREAEVAEQLGHLLQADKLQAFAERQALQVLAEDGSRRLRMLSQGQYSLQADGRGFKVIDHWNADEARSVHTLSGGETFLASLALALGLAEHLPSLSTTPDASTLLESLFIDEGFGQLDQEALDLVASVLEQLSLERYLVGVVTHVEALAERLPAQIKVTKSVGGSRLTTVITSKERFALSGEAL
jgi:exonuclease SbcC